MFKIITFPVYLLGCIFGIFIEPFRRGVLSGSNFEHKQSGRFSLKHFSKQ